MELRRAAETLLRSNSQFLPLLVPLRSTRSFTQLPRHGAPSFICQSCRHLSVQSRLRQQAAARAPPPESESSNANKPSSSSTTQLSDGDKSFLDEAMDSSHTSGASAKHSQHFKSPRAQGMQKLEYSSEQQSKSVLDDVMKEFETSSSNWGAPRQVNSTSKYGSRYSTEQMMFPEPQGSLGGASTAAPAKPRVLRELPIHLSARTGRTIAVDLNKQGDLGGKLRQLEILVARNRIRGEFNKQKFHERPGLKRKRLASERWRKRFRQGFNRVVMRVQELRKKGW